MAKKQILTLKLTDQVGASISHKVDTDTGLVANSDKLIPSQKAVKTYIDALPKPLTFKGTINLPADFPTPAAVQEGWMYQIATNVTDNDATKTNTGLSFLVGDEIAWNGTTWATLGSTEVWQRNSGGYLYPTTSTDKLYTFNDHNIYSNSDDALIKNLSFYKSRGTYASPTVITSGDYLGEIVGYGHDGTNYIRSASIRFISAGTVGSTRIPSRIDFYVSTDATPSVETMKAYLNYNGITLFGSLVASDSYVEGRRRNITTTSTLGLLVNNTTTATAGVPVQMSPRTQYSAKVWNTTGAGSSETSDWIIENLPTSGTTPSSTLKFGYSRNGGTYTYPMELTSGGALTLASNLRVGGVIYVDDGNNIQNTTSVNRGLFVLGSANWGYAISRNLADAYTTATINNANASSTGNILDLQWQSVNRISFTKNGSINLNTTDALGAGTINIGGNRYFHAYSPVVADSNLFLGYQAGNFTMAGTGSEASYNVGLGRSNLLNLTTGSFNTATGWTALQSVTTGSYNVALGGASLRYITTVSNLVAIGYESLNLNITGTGLVAVGYQAGKFNVKGTNNSYFGYQAGYSGTTAVSSITITNGGTGYTAGDLIVDNTGTGGSGLAGTYTVDGDGIINGITITNNGSGYNSAPVVTPQAGGTSAVLTPVLASATENTATGYQALYSNTRGNYNTANGYRSLYSNTTGIYNTANGYASLRSNTTGSYNTANGYQSLRSNTTGDNNTANGVSSLYSNTTGINNTANGYASLYSNTTGNYNTANGYASLYSNTTGNSNTANGYNAGRSITTGATNSFFGTDAGYHASQKVDAVNSCAIGYGAYTTASNQVVIGNASVTQILCGQDSQAEVKAGKLETTVAGEGIILKSPDGTRYKITVANDGTVSASAV